MTDEEAFHLELAAHLGSLHPDYVLGTLTRKQYLDWRQSYNERLWGERRNDDRHYAHLVLHHNPENPDVSMEYPYFGRNEERDLAEHKDQAERKTALDPEKQKAAAMAHIAAIRAGKVKRV